VVVWAVFSDIFFFGVLIGVFILRLLELGEEFILEILGIGNFWELRASPA
jgi:hypothetical protein